MHQQTFKVESIPKQWFITYETKLLDLHTLKSCNKRYELPSVRFNRIGENTCIIQSSDICI